MTLLDSLQSRILPASAAPLALTVLILLFAHRISQVRAAQHTTTSEAARASVEPASLPTPRPGTTPVLVELFTSEGCSSCPPADALLARLQNDQPIRNADIIVLEEHVDYWDSLGWHDRFSSHQLTERQSQYVQRLHLDDSYTPQMVVDGTEQLTGNDSALALRTIARAARDHKGTLTLSNPTLGGDGINLSVSSTSANGLPKSDLYGVLIETAASTQVATGENGGRTLRHVSVVRAMRKIGTSDQLASPLFFSFSIPKDAAPIDLRVVVFAQNSGQGKIVAAASSAAPEQPY